VLATGNAKIALVALDLGRAPTRTSMANIRKRIESAGIAEVFLVASHTHHGPVIELETWPNRDKPYVRDMEAKISEAILTANGKLRPARFGASSRLLEGFNRNRHSKRPDCPVDRELLVLRVEGTDGKPIAHAVNFAAHPTMLDAKLCQFSADYPGALCSKVEKDTGAPCLFLQGAAGDLSAASTQGRSTSDEFGSRLADEVLKTLPAIRLDNAKEPSLHAAREEMRFRSQVDLENGITRLALGRAFFPELIEAFRQEYREGVRPQLTLALLNDKIGFVGVSGEFFCGHALSLKRRARLEHLFFLGYCNDYHQYFPTIEAVAEKGYGTQPPIAPVELGAGEQIMDRALLRLYQMRGLITESVPKR
jgi:hypothetical protein